jgi:hypothetical protein
MTAIATKVMGPALVATSESRWVWSDDMRGNVPLVAGFGYGRVTLSRRSAKRAGVSSGRLPLGHEPRTSDER